MPDDVLGALVDGRTGVALVEEEGMSVLHPVVDSLFQLRVNGLGLLLKHLYLLLSGDVEAGRKGRARSGYSFSLFGWRLGRGLLGCFLWGWRGVLYYFGRAEVADTFLLDGRGFGLGLLCDDQILYFLEGLGA